MTGRRRQVVELEPPVIGWRGWKLRGSLLLTGDGRVPVPPWSRTYEALCSTGPLGACVNSADGRVPGERCGCGVYAWPSRAVLLRSGYVAKSMLHGAIELEGRVLEVKCLNSKRTWLRATRATVRALFCTYEREWPMAERIASRWGVPVARDPLGAMRRTPWNDSPNMLNHSEWLERASEPVAWQELVERSPGVSELLPEPLANAPLDEENTSQLQSLLERVRGRPVDDLCERPPKPLSSEEEIRDRSGRWIGDQRGRARRL